MSSSTLQDLRRAIYVRAKADPSWRFWGLWVHICKEDTLAAAYQLAKRNNGAPGSDGVSFAAIERGGVDVFLAQLRTELVARSYRPQPVRHVAIPKGGGKTRRLSIPTIRDRVVQGAVKLILEPIFEADFQPGSYGYRPKRKAHAAVDRVAKAVAWNKTRVVDLDLGAFFDTVQHDLLLQKVAKRVRDRDVLHVLWQMLKATGKRGVPQGGVISPLLSNLYLTEVDRMLERAKRVTRDGSTSAVEYARYADDLVVLVHEGRRWDWVLRAVQQRLREEFGKLRVEVNEEKSRVVDLRNGESFGFLGFDFRRVRSRWGRWRPLYTPQREKRTALLRTLRDIFRRHQSQPVSGVVQRINPILRGWVTYFAVGQSSRCFSFIRNWVEITLRRHWLRNRKRRGFGWTRWRWLRVSRMVGVFLDYRVRPYRPAVASAR